MAARIATSCTKLKPVHIARFPMKTPALALTGLLLLFPGTPGRAADPAPDAGDPASGKVFFQQGCALCHATVLGQGNAAASGQGPSLVGVVGRRAASVANFGYSRAMAESGITWDPATLGAFLAAPTALVPGTTMPAAVPNAADRLNVIAYLATLVAPRGAPPGPPVAVGRRPGRGAHRRPGGRECDGGRRAARPLQPPPGRKGPAGGCP